MAFVHNLSIFSNSGNMQRFREVHEYTVYSCTSVHMCFAGTPQHGVICGAWIYLSCASMTSEVASHNKTNVVLQNSEMFVTLVLQG